MHDDPLKPAGHASPALEAALLLALALQASGRPVEAGLLRQALGLLGLAPPQPWLLEALCRLAAGGAVDDPGMAGEPGQAAQTDAAAPAPAPAAAAAPGPAPAREADGLYLYALAPALRLENFSCPGVDGQPVELVRAGSWVAVVHRCAASPYSSQSREQVARWVQEHHQVVELAARQAGDVIPVAFNTVVAPKGAPARELLVRWVISHERELACVHEQVAGCQEFGVQLWCDPQRVEPPAAAEEDAWPGPGEREQGAGAAYLRQLAQQQHRRHRAREQTDAAAARLAQALRRWCRRMRPEPLREPQDGLEMVAHFSCLVPRALAAQFSAELERLELEPGCSLRLSGPWPPYSFVALAVGGDGQ